MSPSRKCPQCSAELPAGSPEGLCPKCLMAAGLESQHGSLSAAPTSPHPGSFVPPSPQELASSFPQLEILELLGHGGMGAVYKARQIHLDRLVALKIIRPESASAPGFAERFSREAKTLGRLNHPHIVAVYDFGKANVESHEGSARPLYYFVMEYVDGANLRTLIQEGGLKPQEVLAIVPQVCEALQYAHDEGVVHRDIKPENILIDKRGRVKIADFGLAKLMAQSPEEFTLTGTHQVMGTPRYMAPEQMEGSHAVDHRADIYSLGVVFYELLTGEVPAGHFDPPSKKVEVDVRLDDVVLRSLAREPERRYQRASDVSTDVRSISSTPCLSASSFQQSKASTIATTQEWCGHTFNAWIDWLMKRDARIIQAVQSTLAIVFLICLFYYIGASSSSKVQNLANGERLRNTTLQFGLPNSPWSKFESNPDGNRGWNWQIYLFSWSHLVILAGFAAWGVNWQIEKARAKITGKQLKWWHGSPRLAYTLWGLIVSAEIAMGILLTARY